MIFKIKSIAVGTRDLPRNSEDLLLSLGEYVETAIEYNNDFLVGPYLGKDTKVITRLYDLENSEFLIKNHLLYLRRETIDILLVNYSSLTNPGDLDEVKDLVGAVGIFGEGLSPDDIDRYKELFGEYPKYVSIPLNPYLFKKEVIDKCSECGIGVISYEIFGGPLQARTLLATFGIQFLARFAAYYSDIVVISSGANLEEEMVLAKTLDDLCRGTEIRDNTKYDLDRSVNHTFMGTQRKLHTYSEVSVSGKNHTFKNDFNGYISPQELVISMNGSLEYIPTFDPEDIKASDNILTETAKIMIEIANIKSTTWKEEVSPFYRYLVMNSLRSIYPSVRYKVKVGKIGDVFRITVKNRVLFWKKPLEYVLYISERTDGDGYNVFFRNL